jgi:hypothetical protein
MSTDPQNPQYSDPGPLFSGDSGAYASTGAPGTEGVTAGVTSGPVVGSPPVTIVYQSVQAQPPPPVAVHSGATTAFSDDQPLHQSPLLPHAAEASSTGAGMGSVAGPPHPNVGGR